jgi:hypothetical protein
MQSNFVALLNFEINFILIEKLNNKKKKVSQITLKNLSPKPNYI